MQKGLNHHFNEDEIIPDLLSLFLDASIRVKTNMVSLLKCLSTNLSELCSSIKLFFKKNLFIQSNSYYL